jgi:hypothetical protein
MRSRRNAVSTNTYSVAVLAEPTSKSRVRPTLLLAKGDALASQYAGGTEGPDAI